MEVILLERIERLGQMGDTVNVKTGYARNFLLPQKKAMRATSSNKAVFEQQRSHLEADNLERRQEAESVSGKIDGIDVTIIRQAGDSGQLYGSVSARDIADSVTGAGVTVNRGQIVLDRPIKALGIHETRVVLHPEVSVTVTVNVARTDEEARIQLERGTAITGTEELEDGDAVATAEAALAIADDTQAVAEAVEGLVEEEVAERLAGDAAEQQAEDDSESQPAEPDAPAESSDDSEKPA